MADISREELQKQIEKILKNAKLSNTSTKKVIQKLEADLGVSLADKKKLIDELVMDYVNSLESDGDDDDDVEDEEVEEVEEDDYDEDTKKTSKSGAKKRKAEEKKKPVTKPKKKKTGGGGAKGSGYTRAYKLSPALAELMGAQEMPRHEVVKRMWGIIKEKNLYDPSNRRFVICDKDMLKVIGISRFRAFGMMKYLKSHFLD